MSQVNYRMQGDFIIQEYVREQFRMRVDDFNAALKTNLISGMETPPLPSNTRLFTRIGNQDIYIVEAKPNVFTLTHTLDNEYDGEDANYATLSMPWQYFVGRFSPLEKPVAGVNWQFHGLFLYWAKERVNSLNSPVCIGMTPNIYSDSGLVCLGTTAPESTVEPADRMEILVSNFYSDSSIFNAELDLRIPYDDIYMWERQSSENVLWWKDYRYFNNFLPLRSFLPADNANVAAQTPLQAAISSGEALW